MFSKAKGNKLTLTAQKYEQNILSDPINRKYQQKHFSIPPLPVPQNPKRFGVLVETPKRFA